VGYRSNSRAGGLRAAGETDTTPGYMLAWRLLSSGVWGLEVLVKTAVSVERVTSIFKVERMLELGTMLGESRECYNTAADVITSSLILSTLKMEATLSSNTLVLTTPTLHHTQEVKCL
jgi:hypothetical protein